MNAIRNVVENQKWPEVLKSRTSNPVNPRTSWTSCSRPQEALRTRMYWLLITFLRLLFFVMCRMSVLMYRGLNSVLYDAIISYQGIRRRERWEGLKGQRLGAFPSLPSPPSFFFLGPMHPMHPCRRPLARPREERSINSTYKYRARKMLPFPTKKLQVSHLPHAHISLHVR